MGDKANIAPGILLDPSKVLPAKLPGSLSVSLDIDKIPDELKKTAIGQTANALAELKEKPVQPGETEAQHKLQVATLDEITDWVKMVLNDGGEVTLTFDVDQSKGDLSLSLSLAGKEGTKLAKVFTDLGSAKSVGAGLIGKDSAANVLFHMALPERIRKAMEPVIDEGLKKAVDEEQDKDKRAVTEKMYKALAPTLKTGEFDMGFNLRGPSSKGLYAMVTAVKVKDGAEQAAKKAFAKDKDADKMTLVLEAGDALKLRFKMKAALVTFFGYLAEHQQVAPPPVP
jgi:hypothetical protein